MADKPDSGSRGKALLGVGGKAGLLAGVAGISTVAGLSAAKALRRRRMINDAYEGEDFKLLDADRGCVVTTPDGTSLVVREVGPVTAPLTIVFAHGFCARMGSFHFQRTALAAVIRSGVIRSGWCSMTSAGMGSPHRLRPRPTPSRNWVWTWKPFWR